MGVLLRHNVVTRAAAQGDSSLADGPGWTEETNMVPTGKGYRPPGLPHPPHRVGTASASRADTARGACDHDSYHQHRHRTQYDVSEVIDQIGQPRCCIRRLGHARAWPVKPSGVTQFRLLLLRHPQAP